MDDGEGGKSAFLTVGTTRFEELVTSATQEPFLKELSRRGYRRLVAQVGKGEEPSCAVGTLPWIQVSSYHFKPSLRQDMQEASLVISHGGAGSITEALSLNKPLIVVINEALMNNHQTELALKMAQEGYCIYTTCSELLSTIQDFNPDQLTPYKPGNPKLFGNFLDEFMGFIQKSD